MKLGLAHTQKEGLKRSCSGFNRLDANAKNESSNFRFRVPGMGLCANHPPDLRRAVNGLIRDCSRPGESLGGDFPNLSRETASCDNLAGTCAASLRRVLRLGHAGTSQPTGQRETENDSALGAAVVSVEASAAVRARLLPWRLSGLITARLPKVRLLESRGGFESRRQHSGHYGFLFLFHLYEPLQLYGRCPTERSTSSLGGSFCSLLSLSLLLLLCGCCPEKPEKSETKAADSDFLLIHAQNNTTTHFELRVVEYKGHRFAVMSGGYYGAPAICEVTEASLVRSNNFSDFHAEQVKVAYADGFNDACIDGIEVTMFHRKCDMLEHETDEALAEIWAGCLQEAKRLDKEWYSMTPEQKLKSVPEPFWKRNVGEPRRIRKH